MAEACATRLQSPGAGQSRQATNTLCRYRSIRSSHSDSTRLDDDHASRKIAERMRLHECLNEAVNCKRAEGSGAEQDDPRVSAWRVDLQVREFNVQGQEYATLRLCRISNNAIRLAQQSFVGRGRDIVTCRRKLVLELKREILVKLQSHWAAPTFQTFSLEISAAYARAAWISSRINCG